MRSGTCASRGVEGPQELLRSGEGREKTPGQRNGPREQLAIDAMLDPGDVDSSRAMETEKSHGALMVALPHSRLLTPGRLGTVTGQGKALLVSEYDSGNRRRAFRRQDQGNLPPLPVEGRKKQGYVGGEEGGRGGRGERGRGWVR